MRRFLHNDRQRIKAYLGQVDDFGRAYRNRSFDLASRLAPWLTDLQAFFDQRPNSATQATAVSGLANRLETASRGIDPSTFQKVRTGRRAMVDSTIFYILEKLNTLLADAYLETSKLLEEARALLEPTLLSALQAKVVSDGELTKAAAALPAATALWEKLRSIPELNQVCRRIILLTSPQDAHLLLFELAARLRN